MSEYQIYKLLAYANILSPLFSCIICAFLALTPKKIWLGIFASICIAISLLCTAILSIKLIYATQPFHFVIMDWINSKSFAISFGIFIDQITLTMMVVVNLVSLVVFIYSIGYMKDDEGFNKYFSFLSGFVFSMLVLVMSDNYLMLFVGWEGVGVCSYLLIGFWHNKRSANFASIEAFVMNRITDFALLLGIFVILITFGTLNFNEIFNSQTQDEMIMLVIASLLFIGAMGKSAQFPFHTWLADAMEGPTPVSALIHAATMVTAGVYLLIRSNLFLVPSVQIAIAILGAFVAFFGSTMAIVNKDLKKIIAYSTLSQLGYMFASIGVGAYFLALFHLFTHAFFKSLLFLCAGNIMHATSNSLDITKMGSLYKPLKVSAIFMIIASLALAGIFPLSGFFSKDLILEIAFIQNKAVWAVLFISVLLSSFYSFRLIMLVFFGPKNHNEQHPHDSKKFMLIAMSPLVVLSIFSGFLYFYLKDLVPLPKIDVHHIPSSVVMILIVATSALAICGIVLAIFKYKNGFTSKIESPIYKLLINQYYIPNIYEKVFIKPYGKISSFLWQVIEIKIIDAFFDGIAKMFLSLSSILKPIQSGILNSYIRIMMVGLLILLILVFIKFGG